MISRDSILLPWHSDGMCLFLDCTHIHTSDNMCFQGGWPRAVSDSASLSSWSENIGERAHEMRRKHFNKTLGTKVLNNDSVSELRIISSTLLLYRYMIHSHLMASKPHGEINKEKGSGVYNWFVNKLNQTLLSQIRSLNQKSFIFIKRLSNYAYPSVKFHPHFLPRRSNLVQLSDFYRTFFSSICLQVQS